MKKGMKNEIKLTKKGQDSLTGTKRQKPWRKFVGKQQKINAMHVNPKHKWCMKKIFVKNLKIEKISVSIGRETDSIDQKSGKIRFLKNKAF